MSKVVDIGAMAHSGVPPLDEPDADVVQMVEKLLEASAVWPIARAGGRGVHGRADSRLSRMAWVIRELAGTGRT